MVEKNIRLKTHLGNGVYDTLHPETNSGIVRVGSKNLDETLSDVTAQLAQLAQKETTEDQALQNNNFIPSNLLAKINQPLFPPEKFTWKDIPIKIHRNLKTNEISTDFNFDDFKNKTGTTYYVNINTGNNTFDGLTPDKPIRDIYIARQKSDLGTIVVAGGYYDDLGGFNNNILTSNFKNINVVAAEGEEVIISTARKLAFTKTTDHTNIYQTSRSLVSDVRDTKNKDIFGDFIGLKQVESLSECDRTPNSYCYILNVLYIHTFNSRVPETGDMLVFLDVYNFYSVGDYRIAFKNIKLWGGKSGAAHVQSSGGHPLFVAEGCEFKYSTGGSGGLTDLGYDTLINLSTASCNRADGFNYHKSGSSLLKSIEIDCKGYRNGIGRNTNTDNGSTTHDGNKIIRLNCEYFENEGPNCHDVDTDTQSWNVGCSSHESAATTSERQANYQIETGDMWLDSCVGVGSSRAFVAGSNSNLKIKTSLFDDGDKYVNSANGATLDYY